MVQIGLLYKVVFSFILTILFGYYGVCFISGYILGSEFMQACYRSFKHGYRWSDIYKKPLILKDYLHPKDTAIDLLAYVFGLFLAILVGGVL